MTEREQVDRMMFIILPRSGFVQQPHQAAGSVLMRSFRSPRRFASPGRLQSSAEIVPGSGSAPDRDFDRFQAVVGPLGSQPGVAIWLGVFAGVTEQECFETIWEIAIAATRASRG